MQVTRWNNRFAMDLALLLEGSGETVDEILVRHKLIKDDMLTFSQDSAFERRVNEYRNEIKEKGVTFRMKARAQAEELLTTSWVLIHAPDVSPTVKADLIKSTVKWAGLEPKTGDGDVNVAQGVSITINLGEQQ